MTKEIEEITCCRLCKSVNIKTVLNFGHVALANSYPKTAFAQQLLYPLEVVLCAGCGHVQLKHTVNPEILFKDYIYASGDSPNLVKYFVQYAKDIVIDLNLSEGDSLLEFGANDFTLLREFQKLGLYQLCGVEPATNIFERSNKRGTWAYNDFFNLDTAKKIKEEHGKFKVIISNNTFAHIDCLDSVMEGVVELLSDDGVFIFENAYLLDTVDGLYFDQIYHEHLQYYGIKPLKQYLESFDLEIFDVKFNKNQGGSFRCFVQKSKPLNNKWKRWIKPSVSVAIYKEERANLYDPQTYSNFYDKLIHLRIELNKFIYANRDKRFCCYGCPAKFALFSSFFNLYNGNYNTTANMLFVVDDAPAKQGRYSPGTNIPIVSSDKLYTENIDYCIVSVWNMADFIIEKNKKFQEKGRFVLVLPELKVL